MSRPKRWSHISRPGQTVPSLMSWSSHAFSPVLWRESILHVATGGLPVAARIKWLRSQAARPIGTVSFVLHHMTVNHFWSLCTNAISLQMLKKPRNRQWMPRRQGRWTVSLSVILMERRLQCNFARMHHTCRWRLLPFRCCQMKSRYR